MPAAQTVNSVTFAAITGIHRNRAQRWSLSGILRPARVSGKGQFGQYRFSESDALGSRLMVWIVKRRVKPYLAARLVREVTAEIIGSEWWKQKPVKERAAEDLIVLVYPRPVGRPTGIVVKRSEAIHEISKRGGPGFLIDVSIISAGIRGSTYFRPKCVSR